MRFILIALLALASGSALAAPGLTAPATAEAGSTITLQLAGAADPRDFVTVVPKGTPEGSYKAYVYATAASLKLVMPAEPGDYELRLCAAASPYKTLLSKPIKLTASKASVSSAATAAAGGTLEVSWTGPANERDYIAIGETTPGGRTYLDYKYARDGSPVKLQVPEKPGTYEVRYILGVNDTIIARQPLTVGGVTASLSAPVTVGAVEGTVAGPAQVVAGETFKATWKGPDNPRNYVTIVLKGAREGTYTSSYFYTTPKNNPGNLVAPLVPGEYELRYSTAEKYLTLARAAITVTPAKNEPGKVSVTTPAGEKSGAIEIILDASGSMLQKLGAERRIDIAKKTLTKLTSSTIPAGTPFAFRVFGREVDSCQTDLAMPLAPLNPTEAGQRIAALVAKNGAKTPIGASLDKVADDLKSVTGEKLIVLVTDGEETCDGDPAAAIERLRKAGIGTRVSIVGFALDDEKLATTFRRWSDAGGGTFFDAKDAAGLDRSLTEALRPGFEVVNAQGQVLASGLAGGEAVQVPAGNHTVRIKGRANATKPVTVKSKETAAVVF